MTPWLFIIGVGDGGLDDLPPAARALVAGAEVLIGGERHLAMVPDDGRERIVWPSPFSALFEEIAARRGRRVCVLSTGDPLFYGVGARLAKRFPIEEMTVIPALSSFALACARMGWSGPDASLLTVHGRPVETLHPAILPGARLLVLSQDGGTPAKVAAMLRARGYGPSRMTVLEHMGGPAERRVEGTADGWQDGEIADLNTMAIECVAEAGAPLLPPLPGLPDEAFRNDGQLTKREVRSATLAALAPVAEQRLWDVGAGCGSVAIEWMRAARRARAIAVEKNPARVALIADNAAALGTPDLQIVEGTAPEALADLADPDAVFLGGGVWEPGLIEVCWARLPVGGRLVANAVTLEGEQALVAWRAANGGTLTKISVARAGPVGKLTAWRPLMTVTQLAAVKP
jgi:precorrin-6Y C5,15-methyltransferase (decarboxylating)